MMLPLWAVLLLAAGQEPPPVPLVRVTTHVVEVTLLATGRDGEPAGDLKREELRVWDNGKEQAVAAFERLASGSGAGVAKLSPGIFSNRFGKGRQVYSIILLDALNTRWSDSAWARSEVVRTLSQIRTDERVALFVLGDGLRVVHDFSSDSASLLNRLKAQPDRAAPDRQTSAEWPFSAAFSYNSLFHPQLESRESAAFFQTHRILDTFRALEAIANYVRGVPGRKNLLWVSAGFPLAIGTPDTGGRRGMSQVQTFGEELDRAVRALNAANLAVYPIDARGLTPGNPYINVSTMKEIARQTGGTAYYNRNDVHRAVRAALDDSREVYSVSYVPHPFAEDGAFHRIRIQTSRRGVQLRYRQGYYASAHTARDEPAGKGRLKAALTAPLDAAEIGITARVEREGPEGHGIAVALRVSPTDLDLERNGERWSGAISVGLVQLGPAGEQYGEVVDEVELSLTEETYRRAMETELGFRRRWKRRAEASSLRIAILDRKSGHVGSLSLPLGDPAR